MILDMIQEWFKELLIDGIISNLTGMFDTLNTKVGEIAGEVGKMCIRDSWTRMQSGWPCGEWCARRRRSSRFPIRESARIKDEM